MRKFSNVKNQRLYRCHAHQLYAQNEPDCVGCQSWTSQFFQSPPRLGSLTFAANPKDGTTVTDSEGTEYLLAARGISKAYSPAADGACGTAEISVNAITDANFSLSTDDIPEITDSSTNYPLPSQSWSDKPADSAVECTVTMGDATNCDALDES